MKMERLDSTSKVSDIYSCQAVCQETLSHSDCKWNTTKKLTISSEFIALEYNEVTHSKKEDMPFIQRNWKEFQQRFGLLRIVKHCIQHLFSHPRFFCKMLSQKTEEEFTFMKSIQSIITEAMKDKKMFLYQTDHLQGFQSVLFLS